MEAPKSIVLGKNIFNETWFGFVQGKAYKIVNPESVPGPDDPGQHRNSMIRFWPVDKYEINNKEMLLL